MDHSIASHKLNAELGRGSSSALETTQNIVSGSQNDFFDVSHGPQPGAQEIMHHAPVMNSAESPFTDFSAPQGMAWGQGHTSYHQSNFVCPSNQNFQDTEAPYTTSANNFNEREAFTYSLEPDSVSALLESELAATTFRLAGDFVEVDFVETSRGLDPLNRDS